MLKPIERLILLALLALIAILAILPGCTSADKQIGIDAAHLAVDIAAEHGKDAAHRWIERQAGTTRPATGPATQP